MTAKISVFVTCVEAIIYLLLYNLHDCTFKCQLPHIPFDQVSDYKHDIYLYGKLSYTLISTIS